MSYGYVRPYGLFLDALLTYGHDMKSTFISSIALMLLAGCSSSKIDVVEGMMSVSRNDGIYRRLIALTYPLQTTHVSLSGQLPFKIGDVCVTSSYRSPSTSLCFPLLDKNDSKTKAKMNELNAEFVYYDLPKGTTYKSVLAAQEKYLEINRAVLIEAHNCWKKKDCILNQQKLNQLTDAQTELDDALNDPNVQVYNWSDISGKNITNNTITADRKVEDFGITVVHGFRMGKLHNICIPTEVMTALKKQPQYKNMKIVTHTLESNRLEYKVYKGEETTFKADVDVTTLSNPELIFREIELNILNARRIESRGMPQSTKVELSDNDRGTYQTFLAVVTDVSDMGECG